jgi:hypothetical protein
MGKLVSSVVLHLLIIGLKVTSIVDRQYGAWFDLILFINFKIYRYKLERAEGEVFLALFTQYNIYLQDGRNY